MENSDIIKIVLAIIFPPLGVALQVGIKNPHFWINIVLTLMGWIPGMVHALYVILTYEDNQTGNEIIK